MNTIDASRLSQLVDTSPDPLATVYMPMFHGVDSRQNPVRFENLLRTAETRLGERGVAPHTAREMLAPARALLGEAVLLESSAHGLAAFLADGNAQLFELPFRCEEACSVGSHFLVVPLIRWLNQEVPFFVLAVSQNHVRFFASARDALHEQPVESLPASLDEALRYDRREGMYQAHSAGRQFPGKEGLVFHGQGGAVDAARVELVNFLRQVDRAVAAHLRQRTEPLIFAGVDYLFPIYRQVSSYPRLAATPISGNPELMSSEELYHRAQPIVASMQRERHEAALARYWKAIGPGRASNAVDEIMPAANSGAVDTLFIDPTIRHNGMFDPAASQVILNNGDGRGEDLVNWTACLVLRNGGAVETMDGKTVPGGGVMAAAFRYPMPPAGPRTA